VQFAELVAAKAAAELLVRQNGAATTMQAVWRGRAARVQFVKLVAAKAAAELLVRQNGAATTMQAVWRGRVVRTEYLKIRSAVITIQAYTRGWSTRKQFPKTMPVGHAAAMIQAAFRGFMVRKRASKLVKSAAARCAKANAGATEEMTLGARTVSALQILLTHTQLTFVLRAVVALVAATNFSAGCCKRLVDGNAIPILFQLVKSCNRSKPHMAVLVQVLQLMLNLADCPATSDAVFHNGETVEALINLCQMYRDKVEIFGKALAIMMSFTNDPAKVAQIKSREGEMKRLVQIQGLLQKKLKTKSKLAANKAVKVAVAKSKAAGKGGAAAKATGGRSKTPVQTVPSATLGDCLDTLTRFVDVVNA
jgi:abnormal spindle-like microcephaly-associated protein